MPTREQTESVIAEIERLQSGQLESPRWADMTTPERYAALSEIEWAGFNPRQEASVIAHVLAGEPPEMWMQGMEGRPQTVAEVAEEERSGNADEWRQQEKEYLGEDYFYGDPTEPVPYTPAQLAMLAEEISHDEHAARVRDFGPEDAATYDARMAEAYRYRAEVLAVPPPAQRTPVANAELEQIVGDLERGWVADQHGHRETLLSETHRLTREIGFVGFRQEFMNDPDAIQEYPDAAEREKELREFWDAKADYATFRETHATADIGVLERYRDALVALQAEPEAVQARFYHGISALGRAEREGDAPDVEFVPVANDNAAPPKPPQNIYDPKPQPGRPAPDNDRGGTTR